MIVDIEDGHSSEGFSNIGVAVIPTSRVNSRGSWQLYTCKLINKLSR